MPFNLNSKIYNLKFFTGVLAQLVERLNGIEEVRGSNPLGSTISSEIVEREVEGSRAKLKSRNLSFCFG